MSVSTQLARSAPLLRILWPVWWAAMAVATHVPRLPGPHPSIPHADKVAHVLLYFVLALLGGRALIASGRIRAVTGLWTWGAIYLTYAVLDEVSQPFVQRTASFSDWLADLVGVLAATLILSTHFATFDEGGGPDPPPPDSVPREP